MCKIFKENRLLLFYPYMNVIVVDGCFTKFFWDGL